MTIFYERNGIQVTERWLTIGHRRYAIQHLDNLQKARWPADPIAVNAALLAGVTLLIAVLTAPHPPAPAATVTVALAAVAAITAAIRAVMRPPAHLLQATYLGLPVLLWRTRDRTELGKLNRALRHAKLLHDTRADTESPPTLL
jgi:hypothetical protein